MNVLDGLDLGVFLFASLCLLNLKFAAHHFLRKVFGPGAFSLVASIVC